MRRRLLLGSLALAAVAVTTFFVPAAISLRAADREAQEVELLREAADAAALVDPSAAQIPDEVTFDSGHDYAIYSEHGRLDGEGPDDPDRAVTQALAGVSASAEIDDQRVAAVPLPGGHVLRVAEPAREASDHTRAALLRLGAIALATIAAAGIAAALLADRLTRPLRGVQHIAVRLGSGDFTAPAPPPSGIPEIDDTALALTSSGARIAELLERERELSANTSHQLRTPIAGLRLAVEGELASPRRDHTEILHEALGAIDRLEETVSSILDLARDRPPTDTCTDLGPVLAHVIGRWQPSCSDARRRFTSSGTSRAPVRVRSQAISTVLDVLLENALRHGEGSISIEVTETAGASIVRVRDEGRCRLTEEELFGRRRSGAGGSGIGLHLARTLSEAEGARLRCSNADPTTFDLLLPTATEPR